MYSRGMKDQNQIVTRAILREELKDVTRKDDLSLEVDSKIAPLFYALERKMEKWKDEILTKEDQVIRILVKHEQEMAGMHFNYTSLKQRVVKLEDVIFPETTTGWQQKTAEDEWVTAPR